MNQKPLVGDTWAINESYKNAAAWGRSIRQWLNLLTPFLMIFGAWLGIVILVRLFIPMSQVVPVIFATLSALLGVITLGCWLGALYFEHRKKKLFDQMFLAEVSMVVFPAIWRDRTSGYTLQHALDDNFDAAYEYASRKFEAGGYTCRPDSRTAVKNLIGLAMRAWGKAFDAVLTDAGRHPEVLRLVPTSATGGIVEVTSECNAKTLEDLDVDR